MSGKQKNFENGQSLVEFGFGMVILVILLVGIVDLGRAFYTYITLRDAAQEGAIYGSICPRDMDAIESHVRNSSSDPVDLTDASHVQVECIYTYTGAACGSGAVPDPGTGLRISVVYDDFVITMPFMGAFIGQQAITIQAVVENTILRDIDCP